MTTEEKSVLCKVADIASLAWDWIDKRDIDAHIVAAVIIYGTIRITNWAMHFADEGDRPGLEVAAIIAAIVGPWSALQVAAIKFYFEQRRSQ